MSNFINIKDFIINTDAVSYLEHKKVLLVGSKARFDIYIHLINTPSPIMICFQERKEYDQAINVIKKELLEK